MGHAALIGGRGVSNPEGPDLTPKKLIAQPGTAACADHVPDASQRPVNKKIYICL